MKLLSRFVQWFRGRSKDPTIVALVLLLRQHRELSLAWLAERASAAFATRIVFEKEPATDNFIVGKVGNPTFMLQVQGRWFIVNVVPVPYVQDPRRMAQSVEELRRRKAVEEHQAWVSVDWMRQPPDLPPDVVWPLLGRMAAELLDENCLAVYCPANGRMLPYDPELGGLLRNLKSPEDLDWHIQAPVIAIEEDDPRMQAAVREARNRWPEFLEAFAGRRPDQGFSVKVPLRDGKQMEFIWIEVERVEHETIFGKLGNEPVSLRTVKLGSPVQAPVSELNDWIVSDEDGITGGFTLKVLIEGHSHT